MSECPPPPSELQGPPLIWISHAGYINLGSEIWPSLNDWMMTKRYLPLNRGRCCCCCCCRRSNCVVFSYDVTSWCNFSRSWCNFVPRPCSHAPRGAGSPGPSAWRHADVTSDISQSVSPYNTMPNLGRSKDMKRSYLRRNVHLPFVTSHTIYQLDVYETQAIDVETKKTWYKIEMKVCKKSW